MDALDRLVDRLFDYAGLFPPAALEWDAMLEEAAGLPQVLQRPHLLGNDLVVRPEHLGRLTPDVLKKAGFRSGRRVGVCVVGVPLSGARDVLDAIPTIEDGFHRSPYALRIHAIEVADADALDAIDPMVERLQRLLQHPAARERALYYEPRWKEAEWLARQDQAFELAARIDDARLGLKVRCAGPTALGAEALATLIPRFVEAGRPWKATQGLHHPLAGPDAEVGFLGLLMALRLHEAGAVDASDLAACIQEPERSAFTFTADAASWRGHEIDPRSARLPFAIGSCSLLEPDEGLVTHFGRGA